jgi:hypothetical protein
MFHSIPFGSNFTSAAAVAATTSAQHSTLKTVILN